jgi:hypothetical protein
MRFEKNFPHSNHFFKERKILSDGFARLFIIEEAILLLLFVIQLSLFLGIGYNGGQILFFQNIITPTQMALFILTIIAFLISYVLVAMRDETVLLIHHNFSRLLFGTIKLKIEFTTKEIALMVLTELFLALLVAASIYLYLDPEVNVIPYPLNFIAFAILIAITLMVFSQSKNFRLFVFGATPIQKKLNLGHHELKRVTNKKTGSLRFKKR